MKPFDEQGVNMSQEVVNQIKKELSLISQQLKKPGLTLFEFNYSENTIVPAEIISTKATVNLGNKVVKGNAKVFCKKGCLYIWALNKKNVQRKIAKIIKEYHRIKTQTHEKI